MRSKALLVLLPLSLLAAEAAQDTAKEDLKKLEGAWVMVSGEDKGEKLSEQTIKSAKLTIKGNEHEE